MASSTECSDSCHPERYTQLTTRTRTRRRRWGVRDEHLGENLPRQFKSEPEAHDFLTMLRRLEVHQRHNDARREDRERLPGSWYVSMEIRTAHGVRNDEEAALVRELSERITAIAREPRYEGVMIAVDGPEEVLWARRA